MCNWNRLALSTRQRTALHEAWHAVAAVIVSLPILQLLFSRDRSDGFAGRIVLAPPDSDLNPNSDQLLFYRRRQIVIGLVDQLAAPECDDPESHRQDNTKISEILSDNFAECQDEEREKCRQVASEIVRDVNVRETVLAMSQWLYVNFVNSSNIRAEVSGEAVAAKIQQELEQHGVTNIRFECTLDPLRGSSASQA